MVLFAGGCDAVGCFGCSGYSDRADAPLRTTQCGSSPLTATEEIESAGSTLRLKPDAVTFDGKAACNSYGGRCEAEGKELSLDVRWITEVGCALIEYEPACGVALFGRWRLLSRVFKGGSQLSSTAACSGDDGTWRGGRHCATGAFP